MTEFEKKIYDAVCQIPKGKVSTYGSIAMKCGAPNAYRAVGNCLHKNPLFGVVPCHRVVNSSGVLASAFVFGGKEVQKKMLIDEGVTVSDDYRVDLKQHLF